MSKRLPCMKQPCATCPYRKDVPSGVWAAEEYAKLPLYDDNNTLTFNLFMCHSTAESPCRGWLTVHADSLAARLAMFKGEVTPDDVYAPPPVPLFASGREAAEHGLRELRRPGVRARRAVAKVEKLIERRSTKP